MKTAELIKQAEDLLNECSAGFTFDNGLNGFAQNTVKELIDRLKRYEEVINDLLGWQSMAPAHVLESARKALEDE